MCHPNPVAVSVSEPGFLALCCPLELPAPALDQALWPICHPDQFHFSPHSSSLEVPVKCLLASCVILICLPPLPYASGACLLQEAGCSYPSTCNTHHLGAQRSGLLAGLWWVARQHMTNSPSPCAVIGSYRQSLAVIGSHGQL